MGRSNPFHTKFAACQLDQFKGFYQQFNSKFTVKHDSREDIEILETKDGYLVYMEEGANNTHTIRVATSAEWRNDVSLLRKSNELLQNLPKNTAISQRSVVHPHTFIEPQRRLRQPPPDPRPVYHPEPPPSPPTYQSETEAEPESSPAPDYEPDPPSPFLFTEQNEEGSEDEQHLPPQPSPPETPLSPMIARPNNDPVESLFTFDQPLRPWPPSTANQSPVKLLPPSAFAQPKAPLASATQTTESIAREPSSKPPLSPTGPSSTESSSTISLPVLSLPTSNQEPAAAVVPPQAALGTPSELSETDSSDDPDSDEDEDGDEEQLPQTEAEDESTQIQMTSQNEQHNQPPPVTVPKPVDATPKRRVTAVPDHELQQISKMQEQEPVLTPQQMQEQREQKTTETLTFKQPLTENPTEVRAHEQLTEQFSKECNKWLHEQQCNTPQEEQYQRGLLYGALVNPEQGIIWPKNGMDEFQFTQLDVDFNKIKGQPGGINSQFQIAKHRMKQHIRSQQPVDELPQARRQEHFQDELNNLQDFCNRKKLTAARLARINKNSGSHSARLTEERIAALLTRAPFRPGKDTRTSQQREEDLINDVRDASALRRVITRSFGDYTAKHRSFTPSAVNRSRGKNLFEILEDSAGTDASAPYTPEDVEKFKSQIRAELANCIPAWNLSAEEIHRRKAALSNIGSNNQQAQAKGGVQLAAFNQDLQMTERQKRARARVQKRLARARREDALARTQRQAKLLQPQHQPGKDNNTKT